MSAIVTVLCASLLLTNAADVARATLDTRRSASFSLSGTVTCKGSKFAAISDQTGHATLDMRPEILQCINPGDSITASGFIQIHEHGIAAAHCTSLSVISHGPAPEPANASAHDINRGTFDNQLVRIRGTVSETFRDEIDPNWLFICLESGQDPLLLTFSQHPLHVEKDARTLRDLIGAEISAIGFCRPSDNGYRRMIGRKIILNGLEDISVLHPAPTNPFAVAELSDSHHLSPTEIMGMGNRRLRGRVIARRRNRQVVLRCVNGGTSVIRMLDDVLPACGQDIEAVGRPETDLYQINLSNAQWRPCALEDPHSMEMPTRAIVASSVFSTTNGSDRINVVPHGQRVRIRGTAHDIQKSQSGFTVLTLKSGSHSIPIEISDSSADLSSLDLGSEVEVTGIYFVETESWKPNSAFPHTTGITILLGSPADVRILSRPPWWTPQRLLVVIGSLLAILLGILAWNRALNRLVERRSRQLFREQVAHADDKLKVGERTRLAVELHDSLSQTLTGVSFQIDAAEQARQKDPSQIKKYLDVARQTLKSCREELRNCLWDLRNNALEETNAEVAIRQTVEPQIGDAELAVDFSVPRQRLTDNTFHAILRILRELAVNGVRHGGAAHIAIDGRIDGGRLVISVTDDGFGFDPKNHPGADEGHFGLLGVQERVEDMNGSLTIDSAPGRGSRITIELSL